MTPTDAARPASTPAEVPGRAAHSTQMYEVMHRIDGANPALPKYPLLRGDLLIREQNGTWTKECPGIAVLGFQLTPGQVLMLRPRQIAIHGLDYIAADGGST